LLESNRYADNDIANDITISVLINFEEADARHDRMRPFDPTFHWVDDLHGYHDTDEECEEHNANDDIMKVLEGDWD
jgi:hypothetical protein